MSGSGRSTRDARIGGEENPPRPRRAERRLIVMSVEPEVISGLDLPGSGTIVELGEPIDAYDPDEWTLVSHTFDVRSEGEGLLSVLFERRGCRGGPADAFRAYGRPSDTTREGRPHE